jgi:two-component system KDP operon response regulator KdpE
MPATTVGPASSSASQSDEDEVAVLLVEDDPAMGEVVATALVTRGYTVRVSTTGKAALGAASDDEPDVVILDLGLPDIDGIVVCRQLRRWCASPIIVLSADGAEDRKVAALDEGADDYVTKPFSMPELLARLRVAVRHRRSVASPVDTEVFQVGALTVDTGAHIALVGDRTLSLARKEFELLALLAHYSGRVLTHGAILDRVWGQSRSASITSLRVHVTQLRKKLGVGEGTPHLLTEPGIGYRLVLADEPGDVG